MGGTDVQSAAPVRVGPRAGVRGQPKSPGKAPPGAETSPGRLARASAKLEWKHARPANASPRHRPAPRKIPPLPEVRLLHSFRGQRSGERSGTAPPNLESSTDREYYRWTRRASERASAVLLLEKEQQCLLDKVPQSRALTPQTLPSQLPHPGWLKQNPTSDVEKKELVDLWRRRLDLSLILRR